MDNVLIVVEDLEAARAFFAELGMELEGETQGEGDWTTGDLVRGTGRLGGAAAGPGSLSLGSGRKLHRPGPAKE